MDFGAISGNGYLLIGGLILIGAGLLLISLFVNWQVARSVRADERHREKLYEYYRNTFSQLGVILIGIGVSLFIFFFQQSYQERQRHAAEVRQLLAKMSVRVGRAATVANSLIEFDELIRYAPGGEYVVKAGAGLAEQVEAIRAAERDINLDEAKALTISDDIATSPLAGDIDPVLWFAITEDESEVVYAANQLRADYADLNLVLAGMPPGEAVADPEKAGEIASEVADIFYDMEVLRDRARRLIGRGCWFVSVGPGFLELDPIPDLEANYATHAEWLVHAKVHLSTHSAGGQTCFEMLRYSPEGYVPE